MWLGPWSNTQFSPLGKQARGWGAGDRDLLIGPQVLCFQFHTLYIMITASESLAFQTGLYKLGKFEEHWNGGRSWLQEEKDEETRKGKREEKRR